MLCAGVGTTKILKIILDQNPNINQTDTCGRTALHFAAKAGNYHTLKMLLEVEGIDNDVFSAGGMTPLMYACETKNDLCVVACLENGCNPFAVNGFG